MRIIVRWDRHSFSLCMAMEELQRRWRSNQRAVDMLWGFAASGRGPHVPLLVYGSPGNGKSTLVLEVLQRAGCGVAYVDGSSSLSQRQVYESILAQWCALVEAPPASEQRNGPDAVASGGFGVARAIRDAAEARIAFPHVKCERSCDFVRSTQELLRSHSAPGLWLVLDRVDTVTSAAPEAIPSLLRLPGLASAPVGVVLVSSGPLRRLCGAHAPTAPILVPVHPPQSDDEMVAVLEGGVPTAVDARLYRTIARRVVEALRPAVPDARDMAWLCRRVYPAACGVTGPEVTEADRVVALRRLNDILRALRKDLHGRGDVQVAWTAAEAGSAPGSRRRERALVGAAAVAVRAGGAAALECERSAPSGASDLRIEAGGVGGSGVALADVDLPLLTKFALVACYLCSYVPPDQDVRLFTGIQSGRRRRRRTRKRARSGKPTVPARLLGPKPFPLERAHAVLTTLIAEYEDAAAARRASGALLASHVVTLEQLGLVARPGSSTVSGSVALEQPKLLCTAAQDTVAAIADQLRIDLARYLADEM